MIAYQQELYERAHEYMSASFQQVQVQVDACRQGLTACDEQQRTCDRAEQSRTATRCCTSMAVPARTINQHCRVRSHIRARNAANEYTREQHLHCNHRALIVAQHIVCKQARIKANSAHSTDTGMNAIILCKPQLFYTNTVSVDSQARVPCVQRSKKMSMLSRRDVLADRY